MRGKESDSLVTTQFLVFGFWFFSSEENVLQFNNIVNILNAAKLCTLK